MTVPIPDESIVKTEQEQDVPELATRTVTVSRPSASQYDAATRS
jgi:hypothetical protein